MLFGERRYVEFSFFGKLLIYLLYCQNCFRNQVDGVVRIGGDYLGFLAWGQDIDDRWEGLSLDGLLELFKGNFIDGLFKYFDRGYKEKLLSLFFRRDLKFGLFLVIFQREDCFLFFFISFYVGIEL